MAYYEVLLPGDIYHLILFLFNTVYTYIVQQYAEE